MSQTKVARRSLLRGFMKLTAATLPLAALPALLRADDHRLEEDAPTAKALGYRHDATTVDTEQFRRRAGEAGANQFCHNCVLYQAGSEEGWGACGVFPGKQVAAGGWCNAWAAR